MGFERLRRQLLVAMGVPFTVACWRSQPIAETTTVDFEPARPAPPKQPSASTCVADQLFETVCGTATTCELTGRRFLDAGNADRLVVTHFTDLGAFRSWLLDPAATAGYRASLPNDLPNERYCCYSSCTPLEVATSAPAVTAGPGYDLKPRCIPEPPAGTRVPSTQHPQCPAAVAFDNKLRPFDQPGYGGECCYTTIEATPPVRHYRGRVARVEGAPRVADVARGQTWSFAIVPQLPSDATERARLARRWLADAQLEHASIAAFARLALQLVVHGAPPDLVRATHEAAIDEIEHAKTCFALASAYGGAHVEAAPFDAAASMSGAGTLHELALETLFDGCIGETAAALAAADEARVAMDPVIARVQHQISDDETRHAELAWRILAWCARRDNTLVPRLGAALANLDRSDPVIANVVAPCLTDLLAHVS